MTPILIPSKNIYKKQYEKLIDNFVDLVNVKTFDYKIALQDKTVFSIYTSSGFSEIDDTYSNIKFETKEYVAGIGQTEYHISRAYASIKPYTYSAQFTIPKDENKEFVTQLTELKFDAICSVTRGNAKATSGYRNGVATIFDIEYTTRNTETITVIDFPVSVTSTVDNLFLPTSVKAELPSEIGNTKFEVQEKPSQYIVTVSFVCGGTNIKLTTTRVTDDKTLQNADYPASGTYEIIIPQQLNVSINGISQVVSFENATESFGDILSKNAFNIGENNYLLQKQSVYFPNPDDETETIPIAETFADILEIYKNGKKKLTLLCDINDYYYYDATKPDKKGSIAISRNLTRLTFKEYDEVIPMIKLANGDYVPIAKNEDGTPMVFVVLAIRVFYDGVVWQELTLQQK